MLKKSLSLFILVVLASLLLSFATVSTQVNTLTFRFIKVHQEKVHIDMIEGRAGNPWQYRILADYMLEPLIRFSRNIGVDRPVPSTFIAFRFVQNLLIFVAAFYYYQKLGLPKLFSFLGMSILAWMMAQALYNSDLSFNTYFDVFFYLLAAYLILREKYLWLLPLIILAAFNRETSGLILILMPAYYFFVKRDPAKKTQVLIAFFGMSLIYVAIFFGLRSYFGEQHVHVAYGFRPGKQLLYKNIVYLRSWQNIAMTAGIIPFLALISYKRWSKTLKVFFWVVVPVWGVIHFVAAVVAETRLFLVPLSLIFIPAVLFGLYRENLSGADA